MKTIELKVEDTFYQDIIQSGIDIQEEFLKMIDRIIHKKEYDIADNIIKGLKEIEHSSDSKDFKNAQDFLSELKSEY